MHVGFEGFGNPNTAVGLLIVFQNGDERAAHGKPGTVQRVDKRRLFFAFRRSVTNICTPCLIIPKVGTTGNLAVAVLGRQPDFEIITFAGAEPHVAGRQKHHAVRKLQTFENFLGVRDEFLVFVFGRLGRGEFDQFDLVELVLTNHAARVLANFQPQA